MIANQERYMILEIIVNAVQFLVNQRRKMSHLLIMFGSLILDTNFPKKAIFGELVVNPNDWTTFSANKAITFLIKSSEKLK